MAESLNGHRALPAPCLPAFSVLLLPHLLVTTPGVTGRATSGQEPASHPQGQPREAHWEETLPSLLGIRMLLP